MTKITIIDDLHPEDNAMLQALQSRSPASVEERLKKVRESGSGEFMDKFFVGYGHKSIGDCGTTTIYVEGVSMLCAKAIQDWPLYSGQEASTRYMDFSEAVFHDPIRSTASEMVQDIWRTIYLTVQSKIGDHLHQQYPRQEGEDEATYERAIKARGFDIARAFLPAGASTNLSWHTNLRQASDHLDWLRLHPDKHIQDVAFKIHGVLSDKYTSSFSTDIRGEEYRQQIMDRSYFLAPYKVPFPSDHIRVDCSGLDLSKIRQVEWKLLEERPRGVEVPWFFSEVGQICSEFPLDFGSYRDLQRHRHGTIRMPLLTTQLGFHPWYLEALSPQIRQEVEDCLREQETVIEKLDCDEITKQNYIAMGYMVPCRVTQPLPAFVYRMELRSSKSVHPTLRQIIHEEIRQFHPLLPKGPGSVLHRITLHVDMDPDSWTVRRGQQTITER